ncbi:heavy metal translocating P-type ATPase [Gallaecimonas sp. GXIMD4217]|uniref:heavy metal translocating P-type ATPase n=1 Tax=Gallaecimonas sp. GXIMD4217 TaxID=3131927 RepID=UPI00311B0FA1
MSHCYHCHEPVPTGINFSTVIFGEARAMCCPGCQSVSQAIVDGGLTDYYRFRSEAASKADLVPDALKALDAFDSEAIQRQFVHRDGNLSEITLSVDGLACAACAWLIEKQLGRLPGVVRINVNATTHRAFIRWDAGQSSLSQLLARLREIGYPALPFQPDEQEARFARDMRGMLLRLGLAGLATMQVMMIAIGIYFGVVTDLDDTTHQYFRYVSLLLATPVALYSAQPFYKAAWRGLRQGQPGMDLPVSIAIFGAYCASAFATVRGGGEVYFESISMFTFLLLTGRMLELRARRRAAESSANLLKLVPAVAWRQQEGDWQQVPVSELQAGDRIQIRPGEKVPADAEILDGQADFDEAFITGESLPVTRTRGEAIYAGSLNQSSPVQARVTAVGQDNLLASIVRLQDQAQASKPKVALLADRVARYFVIALLVVASLTYGSWFLLDRDQAFWITLSVLVATCPCALSLATPTALTCAMARLSKLGLMVRRGQALEALPKVDRVVFDKTGTLTRGSLSIGRSWSADGRDDHWLALAAALEEGSEHPIARAFLARGTGEFRASDIENTVGGGVSGTINGQRFRLGSRQMLAEQLDGSEPGDASVYLCADNGCVAAFWLEDSLRDDAGALVEQLKAQGKRITLLTGDGSALADQVAADLGIADCQKAMTPQGKLDFLRQCQGRGEVVLMVGDGINDAPVLAGAQVSIAMGSGTDLARTSADLVLMGDQIGKLAQALVLAKDSRRIMVENFLWALGYNGLILPLAVMGLVLPWVAAAGMSLSSLLVIGNSLRLLRSR